MLLPQKQFVVDTREGTYQLYELRSDRIALLRTYTATATCPNFEPSGVCFAEYGKVVVGGGHDGTVYVFDKDTGTVLDLLSFGRRRLVKTITASPALITRARLLMP